MANEKMREEFKAWHLEEVTQLYGETARTQVEKNLSWLRDDGSFADPMLRLASLAWAASRESLVIELPPMPTAQRSDEEATFSAGGCDMRRKCSKAIEAAGLKVKS